MRRCENCGNEHTTTFEVVQPGQTNVFLCFVCTFQTLARPHTHTFTAKVPDIAPERLAQSGGLPAVYSNLGINAPK